MNEEMQRLTATALQLLQTVQQNVEVEKLPKDFWITLGMFYHAYQKEVMSSSEPPEPGGVIFNNKVPPQESVPVNQQDPIS
jgi:hypothetical protein